MVYNAANDNYLDLALIGLVFLGILFAVLASGFTWPVGCGGIGNPVCQRFGPYPGYWFGVAACALGVGYIAWKHWPRGNA